MLKRLTVVGTLQNCFLIPRSALDYCRNIINVIPSTETLVPLQWLKNKCVYIEVASKAFVAAFPNQLTQD